LHRRNSSGPTIGGKTGYALRRLMDSYAIRLALLIFLGNGISCH